MELSLADAAKATGKAKSTIFNACKSGKISYSKDVNDQFRIDPAELFRVYPPISENMQQNIQNETDQTLQNGKQNSGLTHEVKFLHEKLASVSIERERERETLNRHIEDLQRRLDAEGEERRKLTAILTDQRQPAPGFFARLLPRRA